jgi:hypothetical protein
LPFPAAQLVLAGNGRVQNWMDDMGKNSGPEYRHLLIINSTDLRIQMLDPEHGGLFAPGGNQTAMVELRNATRVTIYAAKFEAHSAGLWLNQGSEVTLFGLGGMDSPNRNVPPARFPPSSIVITGNSSARLHALTTRDSGGMGNRDPRTWSVVHYEAPGGQGNITTPPLERPIFFETHGALQLLQPTPA